MSGTSGRPPAPGPRRRRSGLRQMRAVLGFVLLVAVAWVAWMLAGIERAGPVVVERSEAQGDMPARPTDETGCFEPFTVDWPGGSFRRLEAAKACRELDGSSSLTDVTIYIDRRGREELRVRARRGRLPPDESDEPIRLEGAVRATSAADFSLESEELLLDERAQVVSTSQAVAFRVGEMTGQSGEMEHHWDTQETYLARGPRLRLRGRRTDGREVTVSGDRLRFDGQVPADAAPGTPRRIEVRGSGRIDHEGGHVEGERIDVELAGDADEVRRIDATGGAETVSSGPAGGPDTGALDVVRRLRAGRVVHLFAPGNVLDAIEGEGAAVLTGARPGDTAAGPSELVTGDVVALGLTGDPPQLSSVRVTGGPARLALRAGGDRREATGREIDLDFTATGALQRLEAKGEAELTQVGAGGRRRLAGDRVELGFRPDPSGPQPSEIAFEGGPALLVEHDAAGAERTVVARRGRLQTGPDGQVASGALEGNVELRRPDATALADRARMEGDRVVLTGHASVESSGRISHGDEVVHDRAAGLLLVRGRQHTIVKDPEQGAGAGPLIGRDQPIYVSSDELTLDEAARRARYEGGRPSMRQGDNELRADVLVLDDEAGSLEARGKVESRLRLAEPGTEPAEGGSAGLLDPTRLVDGTSDFLRYDRVERLLRYEGHVQLSQDETELSADAVDALLGEGGGVSELVARGGAFFRSAEGEAEGEVIEYWSETGLVRVTHGRRPARARDVEGSFATGELLEMTLGTRGIRVLSSTTSRTRGASAAVGPEVVLEQ